MRFLFFPIRCTSFHGKTLEERPLGGTETAVIRLAEALDALGHDVVVTTPLSEFPQTKPRYIKTSKAFREDPFDVVIVVRGLQGITQPFKTKKLFFWTGDSWDNVNSYGIGDPRYIDKLDGLFLVSQWHAQTLCAASGFPIDKTFVLRNGIRLSDFIGKLPRQRKRLIYSSAPYRGLRFLPSIFTDLKKKHPDAELHIFSSSLIYGSTWNPQESEHPDYKEIFDELRHLPGCITYGSILQPLLAKEFMASSLWTYPTDFEETGCITAMEAMAGGCVPVTTDLAALKEIIGDAGILIDKMPKSELYRDMFVEACDRLLCDDTLWMQYSQKGRERVKLFDWQNRAQELVDYLNRGIPAVNFPRRF